MTKNSGLTHHLGWGTGRAWRWFVRCECRAMAWLRECGISGNAAKAVLWITKLAVIGVLVYATFWFLLLLVFAVAGAYVADEAGQEGRPTEWRDGLHGFGLYDQDGFRIDPHDPDGIQ